MRETDAARLADLLEDVRRLFKEQVARWGETPGLPVTHILILREIAQEPGLSVSALARRTGLSKGYVSPVVEQMEADGLLRRAPDPRDQRCLRIELTETGADTVAGLFARYRAYWARLLADVPDDEARTMIDALEGLRAFLDQSRMTVAGERRS